LGLYNVGTISNINKWCTTALPFPSSASTSPPPQGPLVKRSNLMGRKGQQKQRGTIRKASSEVDLEQLKDRRTQRGRQSGVKQHHHKSAGAGNNTKRRKVGTVVADKEDEEEEDEEEEDEEEDEEDEEDPTSDFKAHQPPTWGNNAVDEEWIPFGGQACERPLSPLLAPLSPSLAPLSPSLSPLWTMNSTSPLLLPPIPYPVGATGPVIVCHGDRGVFGSNGSPVTVSMPQY
jgi:hypothetical protein